MPFGTTHPEGEEAGTMCLPGYRLELDVRNLVMAVSNVSWTTKVSCGSGLASKVRAIKFCAISRPIACEKSSSVRSCADVAGESGPLRGASASARDVGRATVYSRLGQ